MKKLRSKSLLATLLSVFSLTVLFAATTEADGEGRKFWGSSTECGPCAPYNGVPGSQGVQNCTTTHYVLWLEVSESTTTQNCTS